MRSSTVEAIPTLLYGIEVSYYSLIVCVLDHVVGMGKHGNKLQVNLHNQKIAKISLKTCTMRDMESWAVCYCHFKKCQCKCTFTVIMIDIFKKTVKLT
jgi:hypothetical protein